MMENVNNWEKKKHRRFTLVNSCLSLKLNCRNQKDMDVKWNELDGSIDRRSHNGIYKVVEGLPR